MKKLYIILILAAAISFSNRAQAQEGQTEATFYTSMGEFTVELYDTLTPITVDSFIARVGRGFYDGLIFHRVIDNFMIQGGDPKGDGTGGTGTTIPDEFHPTLKNVPSMLSMANKSAVNTGDCQFFINLVTNAHLDNKHTVFGKVKSNFNIVQAIGKVPVNTSDKPLTDVTMDSVRITKFAAGIEEYYTNSREVSISPNPSTGVFSIDIPAPKTQVVILDMQGREVLNLSTAYETKLTVDLSDKSRGIYLVKMNTKDGATHGRIVVQ